MKMMTTARVKSMKGASVKAAQPTTARGFGKRMRTRKTASGTAKVVRAMNTVRTAQAKPTFG